MADAANCAIARTDRVQAYVAGTLPEAERDAFEVHILECAECRTLVREGAALRVALREAVAAPAPRRTGWWIAGSLAAAAVVAFFFLRPADPLARLARVEPPAPFAGMRVRDAGDSTALRVDSGMALFNAGRYGEAAARLGPAAADAPAATFYLALSLLLAGRPADAIAPLAAAAHAQTPYAAEARLYLAKAWLRSGRADSALAALGAADPGDRAARALADSIRAVLPR